MFARIRSWMTALAGRRRLERAEPPERGLHGAAGHGRRSPDVRDRRAVLLVLVELAEQRGELHVCLLAFAVDARRDLDPEGRQIVTQALLA